MRNRGTGGGTRSRPFIQRVTSSLASLLLALLGVMSSSGTAHATLGTDDYPYTAIGGGSNTNSTWADSSGSISSPYGFDYRNCTDFVAWRLNNDNKFTSLPHGIGTGATSWGTWAASAGYAVNSTPAAGAVAWWTANALDNGISVGMFGHVAYVDSVNIDGSVNIEEYNWDVNGTFDGAHHTRTITPRASGQQVQFIHFPGGGTTAPTYNLQAPSAISDPATGRNIFYVGADGYMYQWSVIGGAWSNVKLQGTGNPESVQTGTSPSAVLDSSTGRNVFYVGTDNAIWQWSVQGGAWVNNRLGGNVLGNTSPSAVVDASSGRNVFYVGADQYIYQLSVQNGAWVNIKLTVGGNAIAAAQQTSPSAVVDPSAGREVFYVGADNQIYQWSVQNNAWADIKLTGTGGNRAAATGSSPSAVVDPSTGSNVFYVGDDNHIWQWSVQNGAWNDFQISGTNGNQTVLAGTSPSAVVDPTTGRNVFYVGPDHQMWQWSVQNGAWNNNTLTNSTGGTIAVKSGTSPSAIGDPSSGRNIFYFDGYQMVWQWSVQSSAWVDFKLQ